MENKVFGYARVSSKEQNEGRQVETIKGYCTSKGYEIVDRDILVDRASGKNFERTNYITLRDSLLRKGDTLVIKELDRLGRNKEEIKNELTKLQEKGVIVRILDIPTTLIELEGEQSSDWVMKMVNNVLIEVLGAIAEQERIKIRSRQREGIELAKKQGKHLGRPKINYSTLTSKQRDIIKENYIRWKNKEITAVSFMEQLELTKNTFYKIMKEYESMLEKGEISG